MTIETETRSLTLAAAINQALDDQLGADEKVFLIGEDICDPAGGVMKITKGLSTKYGEERVRNTPISESAIVGAAIGAALAGYRPVAEIMLFDFMGVCVDQVVNHAAKLRYMTGGRTNVPLTIRTSVANGIGVAAQHSGSVEAWFAHTPGMKVVYPSTPIDAYGLLTACIRDDDPCLFLENVQLLHAPQPTPDFESGHTSPLGRADIKRAGTDVTVVTYGAMVRDSLAAAETVASDGIDVEVLDLRCLVPLDVATILSSAASTRRVLVVHAATRFMGMGAEIAATINEELGTALERPVRRLGAAFTPPPFARGLEQEYLPGPDSIADAIRGLVE